MSIEIYKQVNEELVKKVQELKQMVASLETEVVLANRNFFNERERRILMEKHYFHLLKKTKQEMMYLFKNTFMDFESISNMEYSLLTSPSNQSRKSITDIRRRSSIGITNRSPMKSVSPTGQEKIYIEHQQEMPITEETTMTENDTNSSTNGANKNNFFGLENVREESENLIPSGGENTESDTSMCLSVDMEIVGDNHETQNKATAFRKTVPRLQVNGNRVTQIFFHAVSPEEECMTIVSQELASPNMKDNSNVSDNIDRLTQDFEQNLQLHSTPHSSNASYIENETDTTLSSSRPRRSCAPKKLCEPSLRKKLRNEENVCKRPIIKKK